MIVAIRGRIGSGKDTAAKFIQQYVVKKLIEAGEIAPQIDLENSILLENLSCWEIKKFGLKVKRVAHLLTGYSVMEFEDRDFKNSSLGNKWANMTAREMMIKIGTECMRDNLHPDTWVNALFVDYETLYQQDWIITDLRFKNELKRIKHHNGITIEVKRKDNPFPTINHPSETELDGEQFDYTINNDGTLEEFKQSVYEICKQIGI